MILYLKVTNTTNHEINEGEFKKSKEYVARNMNKWKLNFALLELHSEKAVRVRLPRLPFKSEL